MTATPNGDVHPGLLNARAMIAGFSHGAIIRLLKHDDETHSLEHQIFSADHPRGATNAFRLLSAQSLMLDRVAFAPSDGLKSVPDSVSPACSLDVEISMAPYSLRRWLVQHRDFRRDFIVLYPGITFLI